MSAVFRGVRNCFRYRAECFGEVKNDFFKIIIFYHWTMKHCFLHARLHRNYFYRSLVALFKSPKFESNI